MNNLYAEFDEKPEDKNKNIKAKSLELFNNQSTKYLETIHLIEKEIKKSFQIPDEFLRKMTIRQAD